MHSLLRVAQKARLARPSLRVFTPAARFYSDKKTEKSDKPFQSSLLNDDLLAQAGMDVDESKGSSKVNEGAKGPEGAKDESSQAAGAEDEVTDEQRARWAGTAKKSTEQTSKQQSRERIAGYGYYAFFAGSAAFAAYLARDWDNEEDKKKHDTIGQGYSPLLMWARLKARVGDTFSYYREPVLPVLLPDPPAAPYQRPLTLVLALDDFMIHQEWTREHGWRVAKRPGLDYFLGYLGQYYEIVLFSSQYQPNCEKIIMKLDPYHAWFSHILTREHTTYEDGKFVKDLSLMNRDMGKILIIDPDKGCTMKQPENSIPVQPWKGTTDDQELVKMIPFLEWLVSQNVADVRPILKSFDGTNLPDEFIKREAVAREQFEKDWYAKHGKDGQWASKFLGVSAPQQQKPLMPHDVMRREGQKQYQKFLEYLAVEGPKLLAEEKRMIDEQKALGPKNLGEVVNSIGQVPQVPQPVAPETKA